MTDPAIGRPRKRPGFWSQVRAIFVLSMHALRAQFRPKKAGLPKAGLRIATQSKDRKGVALPLLLFGVMLFVAGNSSYQGIHDLAWHADRHFPEGQSVELIELKHMERFTLERRVSHLSDTGFDGTENLEQNRQDLIRELRDNGWEGESATQRADSLIAHLDQYGMDGFVKRRGNLYAYKDLRDFSPRAAEWFGRVLCIVFGLLFVALVLMPLSSRNKDLGGVDPQLAWLYCLPLTGREILSGRFAAATIAKPIGWIILLPVFTVLFWAMGHGWPSIAYALFATFAFCFATAGVEIAIESALRSGGSFRLKKNAQSIATIVGTLAFILAMAAGIAGSRSAGWIEWLLEHTPTAATALPGRFFLLPTGGTFGMATMLAGLGIASVLCGVLGWFVAAKTLRHGLSSGDERAGARSFESTNTSNGTSLAKFEWLLLLRDRNLATTVLIVPLIMVFYQILINPQMLDNPSAQKLAVLAFGSGIWAALMSAPHVLLSESHSLWMIFGLPVSVSDHFQRRTRTWRFSAVLLAGTVFTGLVLWKGFPEGDWWRVPVALVAVWSISLVVYAIMLGNAKLPDAARGEKPKISIARMYACMLISASVGAVLWFGTPWQILVTLALWWFFGFGMWQSVTHKLQHLLEPTEFIRPQLTVASAIFAIIVFFAAQAIALAALAQNFADDLSAAVLISYLIGGGVSLVFCGTRTIVQHIPFPPVLDPVPSLSSARATLGATGVWALACIAVGGLWLTLLRHLPPLRKIYQNAIDASPIQLEPGNLSLVLLAVVAAPVVEEIVFRRFVFRIMQGAWSNRFAIFANALLFAIVHPALSFPPVFLLGVGTAWLYARTGRLWPSMLLHAIYNAAVVAMS